MKLFLKILKNALYVVAFVFFVSFIIHWVLGIYYSLNGDDVITAQDRVASSYYFLAMIPSGIGVLAGLIPTLFIKEEGLPEILIQKIKNPKKPAEEIEKQEIPAEEKKVENE